MTSDDIDWSTAGRVSHDLYAIIAARPGPISQLIRLAGLLGDADLDMLVCLAGATARAKSKPPAPAA